ncbi:hypothetical protein F5148DRAFT_1310311 [Russula earlei]|uniref:Uncharacterized protein n=1 Tax=Russula earlei TaxID=71964 RepID=A0ACC0TQG5_9AGAM|nr:hypothetical protein F5148DRAFT_1310311 [Russula earlei]
MSGMHIDVILLSLFAIYTALTLPRALILNGFFLRSGSSRPHNNTNLHQADTHGHSGMTRTRPIHSTSTRTNQTMRTLVDMLEDEEDVTGGVAMAKNKNKARAALITPPCMAAATTTDTDSHHTCGENELIELGQWGRVIVITVNVQTLGYLWNRMYTLFFTVHVTGVTVLFTTYKHSHATLPYILAAVGLYVFNHLAHIAQTQYTTAWLTAKNALNGSTRLGAGWRAGQHVRLHVVSRAWFSWWATWLVNHARPFTIAAGSDSSGMMLPVKAQGSWTRSLLRMSGDVADARPEEKFTDIH